MLSLALRSMKTYIQTSDNRDRSGVGSILKSLNFLLSRFYSLIFAKINRDIPIIINRVPD